MFHRYTEKARRTIFFARYEASQVDSPYIETEHLLLAIFREDKTLSHRLLPSRTAIAAIRGEIERSTLARERCSTSVDIPLSDASKRVLAYASEEAERVGHLIIGTEHLLLGLLREQDSPATQLLASVGVTLTVAREVLQQHGPGVSESSGALSGRTFFPIPTVKVADLAASSAFYTKLGFRPSQQQPTGKLLILGEAPSMIVLFDQTLGPNLLCFAVSDLRGSISQLHQSGIHFEQALSTHANHAQTVIVRDPDGTLVCLLSVP